MEEGVGLRTEGEQRHAPHARKQFPQIVGNDRGFRRWRRPVAEALRHDAGPRHFRDRKTPQAFFPGVNMPGVAPRISYHGRSRLRFRMSNQCQAEIGVDGGGPEQEPCSQRHRGGADAQDRPRAGAKHPCTCRRRVECQFLEAGEKSEACFRFASGPAVRSRGAEHRDLNEGGRAINENDRAGGGDLVESGGHGEDYTAGEGVQQGPSAKMRVPGRTGTAGRNLRSARASSSLPRKSSADSKAVPT